MNPFVMNLPGAPFACRVVPMVQPVVNYALMVVPQPAMPQFAAGTFFPLTRASMPTSVKVSSATGQETPLRLRADGTYSKSKHFNDKDDEALIRIVEKYERHGVIRDWVSIAQEHGSGYTGRQCRDRWHNYLRPPLERSPITPDEKRELVRAAVQHKNNWAYLSSLRIQGKYRSCAMIKNACLALLDKLARIGVTLTDPSDVDCLPPEAFDPGNFGSTPRGQQIRDYYTKRKQELVGIAPAHEDDENNE